LVGSEHCVAHGVVSIADCETDTHTVVAIEEYAWE
jgi:hypothetical protein